MNLAAGTILNQANILAVLGFLFVSVLLLVGIRLALMAHHGNFAGVLGGVGIVLVALLVWGVAHGNPTAAATAVAHFFTNL
jgi:hypothetical protein